MKAVSKEFKDAMLRAGREIKLSLKIDGVEYSKDVVSINPFFDTAVLSTCMKCCNVEVLGLSSTSAKQITDVTFSVNVGTDEEQEWQSINFGNYNIDYSDKDTRYIEEKNSFFFVCYDDMKYTMQEFEYVQDEEPAYYTLRQLVNLIVANINDAEQKTVLIAPDSFTNDTITVSDNILVGTHTYRDVLEWIAVATGSVITIKNSHLIFNSIKGNTTNEKIGVEYMQSLSFGEQFKPINSINFIGTETTIPISNATSEINAVTLDNPLINYLVDTFDEKAVYTPLDAIYEAIQGAGYDTYDFNSYGIGFLDVCDKFELIDSKNNAHSTLMLASNFVVAQGISEKSSLQAPQQAFNDYKYTDTATRFKKEITALQLNNSVINKRLNDAVKSLDNFKGGYVTFVDNNDDGEYDEIIVSEYKVDKTEGSLWRTKGKCIRINVNGIGVSSQGVDNIADFAVHYDESLKKYVVDASDIAVGTLKGIRAEVQDGLIGGFTIGTNSISSSAKDTSNNSYIASLNKYQGNIDTNSAFSVKVTDANGNVTWPVYIRYNGNFVANKATLKGDITATSFKATGTDPTNVCTIGDEIYFTHTEDGVSRRFLRFREYDETNDGEKIYNYLELYADKLVLDATGIKEAELYMHASRTFGISENLHIDNNLDVDGNIYDKNGSTVTGSDKNIKNSIKELDKESSASFIYSLKPSKFKYNEGTSNRYHHGFIAQDVKNSMGDDDWGVYVKADELKYIGLRYEELIADMVATLQLQKQEINELKAKIEVLTNDKN